MQLHEIVFCILASLYSSTVYIYADRFSSFKHIYALLEPLQRYKRKKLLPVAMDPFPVLFVTDQDSDVTQTLSYFQHALDDVVGDSAPPTSQQFSS